MSFGRSLIVMMCMLSLAGCQMQGGYQATRMVMTHIDSNERHHLISIGSLRGTIDRQINVTDAGSVRIRALVESGELEFKLYDMNRNELYGSKMQPEVEWIEEVEHSFAAGVYTIEISSSKARNIRIELIFESGGRSDVSGRAQRENLRFFVYHREPVASIGRSA